jgi:hypothetical protein
VRSTLCELMLVRTQRVQQHEEHLTRMYTNARHSLALHHTSSSPITHTAVFRAGGSGAEWFVLLRMVGEGDALRGGVACGCDALRTCSCSAMARMAMLSAALLLR